MRGVLRWFEEQVTHHAQQKIMEGAALDNVPWEPLPPKIWNQGFWLAFLGTPFGEALHVRYLNRNGAHNPMAVCKLSIVGPNAKNPRCHLKILTTFELKGRTERLAGF